MELIIAQVIVPDLGEARRLGSADPILGRLLAGGSWFPVGGIPGTTAGAGEVVAAARGLAEEAEVPVENASGYASWEASGNDRLVLLGEVDGVSGAADLVRIGSAAALCLLVAGRDGTGPLLAILYGQSLPILGEVPSATLEDLRTTWADLLGRPQPGGRNLLHEQPEAWDPQLERQLTQRLRQLYGE